MALLTVNEVVKKYGIGLSTLNNLRGAGKGPKYTKKDRRIYYSDSAIATYLKERKIGRKKKEPAPPEAIYSGLDLLPGTTIKEQLETRMDRKIIEKLIELQETQIKLLRQQELQLMKGKK